MPSEEYRALLDDLLDAGNLYCKFGSQLKAWGEDTRNAVYRAKMAGVAVDIIRMVLVDRDGHDDCAVVKTMRDHFNRTCRCPKRR